MNDLENMIAAHIRQQGPMAINEFMALALGHPTHGYYMKQDPFGRQGDFITAPDVSQMFGEMIAAWLFDVWEKSGSPASFSLLECGPGRGTLMQDILRATQAASDFHAAISVHLMEMSPVLMVQQKQTLQGYNVQWHSTMDTIPDDRPLFVIGNEFFDALPVQQLIKIDGEWVERRICLNEEGDCFEFCVVKASSELQGYLPKDNAQQNNESVFEVSKISRVIMEEVTQRVVAQGGCLLFIDYGHVSQGYGETLQAVKSHQYAPVLESVGDSDLTVHVDFESLLHIAREVGVQNVKITKQGDFLNKLGIKYRAQALSKNANDAQQKELNDALVRLTNTKQMGDLFKVICAVSGDFRMEGFA